MGTQKENIKPRFGQEGKKKKMEEIMKGNGQTQSCKEIRMKTDLYILHLY